MSDIDGDEFEEGVPEENDSRKNPQDGKELFGEEAHPLWEPNEGELERESYEEDESGDWYNIDLGMENENPEDAENPTDFETENGDDRPTASYENDGLSVESPEGEFKDRLDGISRKLDALRNQFLARLENDAYKDKLIDALHRELQAYKNDLVKKHVQSMVMDVIKIIDDIRKLSDHYQSMEPEELEPAKLLQLLERIPGDLEDLFFYQGIKPFTCDGTEFDPTRQRVLKRIETPDPFEDKRVAESLKPGYEWDGKVIRPEIVAVYLYRKTSDDRKIGKFDE